MTIHSLTVSIPEGKSSFKDRYELFRAFSHSPLVALFLSAVTFRKDRVGLADLFAKKLHHLARPKDEDYRDFDIDWKTLENGARANFMKKARRLPPGIQGNRAAESLLDQPFLDFMNKVQRLVVSSVLGGEAPCSDIKSYRGQYGDLFDVKLNNIQHFLTLMTERFEVDKNKREITLKNLFNQIYQAPYHHPAINLRLYHPIFGERRIKDDKVDQVWRGVFLDSVKDLEDEPCVKKIYELQKLILKKICNSDASDQDDQTQFAEFEKYVKTQPRR
jgi:hypothetical protein